MPYNQYLYWLSVQTVPITDIIKGSISAADIIANLIISTSLQLAMLFGLNHKLASCILNTSAFRKENFSKSLAISQIRQNFVSYGSVTLMEQSELYHTIAVNQPTSYVHINCSWTSNIIPSNLIFHYNYITIQLASSYVIS